MKKRYDSPITEVVIMDVTQNFLEISAHGAQHEGFTGGSDLSSQVVDGTDDDSPF
ncbi:single-stranded DNA-binding protein [Prevotella pallens]|uniref:single-stranded DNA-binding protein n=1 Tax=Prevotella pallens TaxID=60133 RepID=UPI0028EA8119|nr:single-stranded DNA-binding protein [Prevotella pallens]